MLQYHMLHFVLCYIVVAVKQKYESMRRQWKELDLEDHDEIQWKKIKAKKYRQRKRRVSMVLDPHVKIDISTMYICPSYKLIVQKIAIVNPAYFIM